MRPFFLCLLLLFPAPLWAEPRVPSSQAEIQLSFAPLVRSAAPAVVNIYARRLVEVRRSPFAGDPFFEDFFRGFADRRPRLQNSLGSGVILSEDGIVVSNYHVVGEATDIRVVLNDRREFSARVLLGDEDSDLAILQLDDEAQDLPYLALRDSDSVEVGELVLAIGNPFGVGQTVSSGIVSGLARSGRPGGGGRSYFLQTDAPINPGNSGGALIDMAGRLIGVNTSILTRSGGSNGIGFAIPANLVTQFVAQARDGKSAFARPWAGLTGQPVDADLAEALGLSSPDGIAISRIHPASPFMDDFLPGDVIIAVDGEPVNSPQEMVFRLSVAGLGATSIVTRLRGESISDVPVTLVPAPEVPERETVRFGERSAIPDLVLSNANPAVAMELKLPDTLEGVVVIEPGAGQRIGLRRGDVIVGINGRRVERPRDVEPALATTLRRGQIDVVRGDRRVTLRFRL